MYQPFHHKYRPQTFSELVGQNAIATALTNAVTHSKIAPAYLFSGPRGTGKTSSARILAKSLNCLNNETPTASPCGQCSSCRDIANGTALDVLELDAASNNGVDQIREICTGAHLAPVSGRYKIYVVDEAHGLSGAAAQALLKTLEEPPERVVFILCTTEPQKLPNTIISRCQRFNFRRIDCKAIIEHLRHIAQLEDINIDDTALQLVAQLATGGLRDAQTLFSQLSLLEKSITAQQVWELVGAVPEQKLLELVEAIASSKELDALGLVRTILDAGSEPLIVLHSLTQFYTKMLIALAGENQPDSLLIEVPIEQLRQLASSLGRNIILAGIQHLRSCEAQIKFSTQSWLWLEIAVLGLLPESIQISHNINSSNTLAVPVSAPNSNIWQTVLTSLPPALKVLLSQHGSFVGFQGNTANIQIKSIALKQKVDSHLAALESAFSQVTSLPIKVEVSCS
mgnify:FL=1